MLTNKKIEVTLQDLDLQGNCKASIRLPLSGRRIKGFTVKPGLGGGVLVHMPAQMGTSWTIDEIGWAEVRKQITAKYLNAKPVLVPLADKKDQAEAKAKLLVELHDFDEDNNCLADITLPLSERRIKGFTVKPGLGGGVLVHMPAQMGTNWTIAEIGWTEVRKQIIAKYLKAKPVLVPLADKKDQAEAKAKLLVELRDFDQYNNCLADVTLPDSGTRVAGFMVKPAPGGELVVHMPAQMKSSWTIAEIEWAEVREQITAEYLKAEPAPVPLADRYDQTGPKAELLVELRDFDQDNNCLADITLPDSAVTIRGLKVISAADDEVLVQMPDWLHARWSYPEMNWSEVRQIVASEYRNAIVDVKQAAKESELVNDKKDEPVCSFYAIQEKLEVRVDVTFYESDQKIFGIHLLHHKDEPDNIQVFMPRELRQHWAVTYIERGQLIQLIITEYHRQILQENSYLKPETIRIKFYQPSLVTSCKMDLKLAHHITAIRGFRFRQINQNKKIIISTPSWMGRWKDKQLGWYKLCLLITDEYHKYMQARGESAQGDPALQQAVSLLAGQEESLAESDLDQQVNERTDLGRLKNAESSPIVFSPRTVLRTWLKPSDKGTNVKKRQLFYLVPALHKGSLGGFGPFEFNILEWIDKLRYATSTMIMDLIEAGYVSFGWRDGLTQSKIMRVINRMSEYDLINLTRFVTVDDEGKLEDEGDTIFRIMTMGRSGNILLRELAKQTYRYSVFDVFQDGNTVKRYLAANQWLVYWLHNYREEIGENYETSYVIQYKGPEYTGARIYASVTVNDCTMVAEPVRRVEEFERESNQRTLLKKAERMTFMFDNADQLYHNRDEISFPQRPIIVFVCEDDDHIREVWNTVKAALPGDKRQTAWFTHDLRIFNHAKKGERFLYFENDEPSIVNLAEFLGQDNEL